MNSDMKYNYEFLRKCHGLRFRAEIAGKPAEGIVKVDNDKVYLCHGKELLGYPDAFHRAKVTMFFCEDVSQVGVSAFEIVPRDPETYKDWQVGDKIIRDEEVMIVIFRCSEVVFFKYSNDECSIYPYTCKELYDKGYRLVLTDIEKQILDERQKAEWQPQDGDICYVESVTGYKDAFIYKAGGRKTEYYASSASITLGAVISDENIITLRPATEEEKHKLFDALAKQGKRWNAEKKCVEDIPKPYKFRKGDPVLVRDNECNSWRIGAYVSEDAVSFIADTGKSVVHWRYCIPYNDRTMHLLGTAENYEEGER